MDFEIGPNWGNQDIDFNNLPNNENVENVLKKSISKNTKYKTSNNTKECLVLWDIENVNFFDDYKVLSNYINKKDSLLYVVCKDPGKYPRDNRLSKTHIYTKLKKRGWSIDKRNKKIDERLMSYYHKHKNNVRSIILITADSDFEPILKDAVGIGLDILVLNEAKHAKWFKKYNYKFIDRNILNS